MLELNFLNLHWLNEVCTVLHGVRRFKWKNEYQARDKCFHNFCYFDHFERVKMKLNGGDQSLKNVEFIAMLYRT